MVEDRGSISHEPREVQVIGNTNPDGSGTIRIIKVDNSGNQGVVLYDENGNAIKLSDFARY